VTFDFDWNEPWGCSPLPSRAGKRRSAIEPTIGHLKSDHRLERNFLRVKSGDWINALMSAVGYNFCKLLKALPALCFSSSGGAGIPWRGQLGWVKPGLGIPSGHYCQRKSGWHDAVPTKIGLGRFFRDD